MTRKGGLGKGLQALIPTEDMSKDLEKSIVELKINEVEPNTRQPRRKFEEEKLNQLATSIKENGIIQPIIVRKEGETYRIIAGERRWRAARIAGLSTVPAVIKNVSDQRVMELALIENLQREDLNPLEEAEAYQRLMEEYKFTQEDIAQKIGKSRSAIANTIRLLSLDHETRQMIMNGDLTSGHGRALLGIGDVEKRIEVAKSAIENDLSVRELERLVQKMNEEKSRKAGRKLHQRDPNIISLEDRLKNIFGTKVQIIHKKNKGKITIDYYSNDDLERILEILER